MEETVVHKLLPVIVTNAKLEYLCTTDVYRTILSKSGTDISLYYYVLHAYHFFTKCAVQYHCCFLSGVSISREIAKQLLLNVCDMAIKVINESEQEPLSDLQQEWFLMLTDTHQGLLDVRLAM